MSPMFYMKQFFSLRDEQEKIDVGLSGQLYGVLVQFYYKRDYMMYNFNKRGLWCE